MNNLEALLNKLIALGRKPWGDFKSIGICSKGYITEKGQLKGGYMRYSLDDLCSIESGLWQFVCEKKLYKKKHAKKIDVEDLKNDNYFKRDIRTQKSKEYRLMKSAIQTDKGNFLIQNIKIDE